MFLLKLARFAIKLILPLFIGTFILPVTDDNIGIRFPICQLINKSHFSKLSNERIIHDIDMTALLLTIYMYVILAIINLTVA